MVIALFPLVLFLAHAANVQAEVCRGLFNLLRGSPPHIALLERSVRETLFKKGSSVKSIKRYETTISNAAYGAALEKVVKAFNKTKGFVPQGINIDEIEFTSQGTQVNFFVSDFVPEYVPGLHPSLPVPFYSPPRSVLVIPISISEENLFSEISVALHTEHIKRSLLEFPSFNPLTFLIEQEEGLALGNFRRALEEISPIVSSLESNTHMEYHRVFERFSEFTIKVTESNKTWGYMRIKTGLTLFVPSDVEFSTQSVEEMAGLLSKATSP